MATPPSLSLDQSLRSFVQTFRRSADHVGRIDIAPSSLVLAERFPLGPALTAYYETLEMAERPRIGGQLNLRLYRIDELARAQQGWRWITDAKNGTSVDPHWPAEWIVFADSEGNAVFVDATTGSVHGSIQKVNRKLADDLASFFAALSEAMKVVMEGFDGEILDEDFNLLDPFLAALHDAVSGRIGEANARNFVDFFFG